MTIYTTPLQIGYFFALIMTLVFIKRGLKEERLSDFLLGFVMLILALELQDYTFGFAGINFLWNELNGFPRDVSLLFGPAIYFYLRSQFNRQFALNKKHLLHLLPWASLFLFNLFIFSQGSAVVQEFQKSIVSDFLDYLEWFVVLISYLYYFYHSIKLFREYQSWTKTQFSAIDLINFQWFKNFINFMIVWVAFREIMSVIDFFLNLNYYQDWWWNLALAATSIYVGLQGYAQKQPHLVDFENSSNAINVPIKVDSKNVIEEKTLSLKIEEIMKNKRLYLQPELNLKELAKHLNTNTNLLSAAINNVFNKNFNDYVNELRIQEFENKIKNREGQNLTLLALAYDCGFNSKATFNRAYKKLRNSTPKEFMATVI